MTSNSRRFGLALCSVTWLGLLVCTRAAFTDEPPTIGIEKRVPWTTSRVQGSPERPLPYVTERVFPSLEFHQCLDMTVAPGGNRFYVVEQSGKIFSFPNDPTVTIPDLALHLSIEDPSIKQVYALAFHPDFEKNRYCYICYIKDANLPDGTHVARYRVSQSDPPTIDYDSETTLVTWPSGGHNGCCLKFGPDGYLYISTGDGGPANPPDPLKSGQDVSNLLSCILRIDVDHADGDQNYSIPADNPFVDLAGARGEIWAYGLRNPWRMSFDRETGDLWVGDVGWEMWEMLYHVKRGGNYGWAVLEGRQAINPEWPRGPTPILPPTIDHLHTESSSITEGATYYGARLKELHGVHIYGDYDTGKFWGFRYQNGEVVEHRELADTTHRIVGFAEGPDSELLVLDHVAGTIHRLVPNPQEDTSRSFPRKLSESGLFANAEQLSPAAGVLAYSINSEPWADHAVAERLVAVPNEASINAAGATYTFPKDSVLVKTLSIDMKAGDALSRRRIETQLLHFDGTDWMPYTYQWNAEQTDATLVDANGAEQELEISDSAATGGKRHQVWRFAGRAECQRCHNKWSGPALAFNTPQLNRQHVYDQTMASQIDTLAHIGLLEKAVTTDKRAQLADPKDTVVDLSARARSYLQVNCAHCHRKHAGGAVLSQMHYDLPLEQTNMLDTRPSQGTFGIHGAEVIASGDPFRSVLLYRMAKLGGGRMPHIGSTHVDAEGVALLQSWIEQLPVDAAGKDPSHLAASHSSAIAGRRQFMARLKTTPAANVAAQAELVDGLLTTTSGALQLLRAMDTEQLPEAAAALAVQRGARHELGTVRDLFERFLPPDQRVQRLGTAVQPQTILALKGEIEDGRKLFFETAGVSCRNCHRIQEIGKQVGPDLTSIGKSRTREQLLESLLEPSKRMEPKYVTHLVETSDGRLFAGLLIEKTDQQITLLDAKGEQVRIPQADVEQLVSQRQSLMPDLLFRDMTAQQVADLVAYLASLK